MYLHLKNVPTLLSRGKAGRRSLRRMSLLSVGAVAFLVLYVFLRVTRGIDRILYPKARRAAPRSPLFIMATPRSGSTYLHHLLAIDEETFTHYRLYHTLFPSTLVSRMIDALARIGGGVRRGFGRVLALMNSRIMSYWDSIHPVSLDGEEEDEVLFIYALHAPTFLIFNPYASRDLWWLDALPRRVLERIASDYRATVGRHVYAQRAGSKQMLIKNAHIASRLQMTQAAFPEAKYIHLVRDPVRSVPSAVSLYYAAWKVHSPAIAADDPETRAIADMFIEHYRALCEFARGQPVGRVLRVYYEELVADPVRVVEQIYDFLGHELSETARARLLETVQAQRSFKSAHKYTIEEFGLTPDEVRERLSTEVRELGYAPESKISVTKQEKG